MAQKSNTMKFADSYDCSISLGFIEKDGETLKTINKNDMNSLLEKDEFTVKVVINTTNVLDSHGDVHIKGLWKKSIKENRRMMHVQEHKSNEFNKIIADGNDLKVFTKTMSFKELGFESEDKTEALIFQSNIKKSRNPFMHEQYAKGYVSNHSVGMRYVKMALCAKDERYEEEYANWNKYIGEVANKEDAEARGYFWAVTEAKAIEGSAVPVGSNAITPTLSAKSEPTEATRKAHEAEQSLQAKKQYFINLLNH